MKRWGWLLFALLGAVLAVQAASQSAQTILDTTLTSAPYSDASPVTSLPNGSNVTILERQGGWYHVRLDSGQDGWLPMTSLRLNSAAPSSTWGFGWLTQLFESGRSGATGTTATTGVRGLNQGMIQNATPDYQAVSGLAAYAATPDQARSFAAQLHLQSKPVPYLPTKEGQ